MLDKLRDVERRFEELNQKMADPEIAASVDQYRKVSKERAKLEPVVNLFREYSKIEADYSGARELLESDDDELRDMAKAEIKTLGPKLEEMMDRLKVALLPKDPLDEKSVVLEIRAAAGSDEAALFAGELFDLYNRYAAEKGWRVEVMNESAGPVGGYKEIIATIEGDDVYSS